jgi:hypothetical protein
MNIPVLAQEGPTPTAAPITLPQAPTPTAATLVPTVTPVPTQPQGASLEAITEANVRSQADPSADLLGTIRSGETYPVIGRYFRWYQFRFPLSPTNTGWVFEELVTITGDTSTIIDLASLPTATVDPIEAARLETLAAVTAIPGGVFTLTAESLAIPLPVQGQAPQSTRNPTGGAPEALTNPLPTFTSPPNVALLPPDNAYSVNRPLNAPSSNTDSAPSSRQPTVTMPPILPIALLMGAGILGLLISIGMRR